jgi:DUF1980 C-terminal domain
LVYYAHVVAARAEQFGRDLDSADLRPFLPARDGGAGPGSATGCRARGLCSACRLRDAPAWHRAGPFQVARFQINCCIADAMVLYVTVDPPAATPADDTWFVVTGPLAKRSGELIVEAETVREISPPEHPYLRGGVPAEVVPVRHGTQPPNPTAP